jgi:hypothetical protein
MDTSRRVVPTRAAAAMHLRGRGFDDGDSGRLLLQEKRQHAMRATADFNLRVKSLQNDAGA